MYEFKRFYIDGAWVTPPGRRELAVINPATEQQVGTIMLGTAEDVDVAVKAARAAFETYSQTSREERVALLERIIKVYQSRMKDVAQAISDEMGAPMKFALNAQAGSGLGHFMSTLAALKEFEFEETLGTTQIRREPVGVCGLITPWNWPLNQIGCKVAPALAAGCTMVLKPSEVAPLSAHIFAEIMHEAGVPKGVFNMIDGDGPTVGEALSRHPDIDMMSFTGSTRAGVQVAKAAAETVKRVSQELGGKSANIILEDADLNAAVKSGVLSMMSNTGQSCNAPSRMLVPKKLYEEAVNIAKAVAAKPVVGDPKKDGVTMGPVANKTQFEKIQRLLQTGIDEGATAVVGGPGRPDGIDKGYFIKPTVFANVNNNMTIAREEIFGPVLVMIPYETEEEAVRIANDTVYGLSGYVYSGDIEHARKVARRLRTGMVHLNGASTDVNAPFGGYKQSGNGREWGKEGLKEFLEVKAMMGYSAA
ncbi:aldehyde dehydrogenase [Steroidobacter agaridevorans]|uniref:Aldehyde dehydrogenase n=1 Tax=Steroidobacter agaridevorans TaxID=2695856 RepID=A0A829Y801_9GAMM|nr:aldehyde dehydrogenase family protein [Steroidobacter agaridevorans]GFE78732.1 aldehyde dehydrogenase [Steroidobacter agaridevorans]GFE89335.1 aldehyde dehydrogenase [Steroidobacter agaridevorans]